MLERIWFAGTLVSGIGTAIAHVTGQDIAALVGMITTISLGAMGIYQKACDMQRAIHAADAAREIQEMQIRIDVLRKAVKDWEQQYHRLTSLETPDPDGTQG